MVVLPSCPDISQEQGILNPTPKWTSTARAGSLSALAVGLKEYSQAGFTLVVSSFNEAHGDWTFIDTILHTQSIIGMRQNL